MTTATVNKEVVEDYTNFAMRQGKRIRIAYVDKKGGTEVRVIEPFHITNSVINAYCHLRQGPRHFSLDRIVRIAVLDEDRTQDDPFVKTREEQAN